MLKFTFIERKKDMKRNVWFWLLSALLLAPSALFAEGYIVRDGQPLAEIVTADEAPPSVRLAARELQDYLEKISGATLPLRTETEVDNWAGESLPVRILVGASRHAAQLGVRGDDLEWGAYRIRSGDGWLALIGNDTVFTPRGIYSMSRNHWQNEGQPAWDEATGAFWGNPIGAGIHRHYNAEFDLWSHDEKGTLNAVYGFLYGLGVRWYMAGELGEIVPQQTTLELPEADQTVLPDFNIRMVNYSRYGLGRNPAERDAIIWSLRLGVNKPFGWHTHHGIANITRRDEVREKHPEFFALFGDARQLQIRTAAACLSSEGLFEENLRFVRFLFDMYDVPVVDVMPDDGFSSICQCDQCRDLATPERGRQGLLSDYVWDYVNRIAIEVAKSHPDKYIKCGAYSTYWLPPENIDRLSDNVIVYLVNARRRVHIEEWQKVHRRQVAREWKAKSGNPILTFQNPGSGANTPRIFAEDIQDLKGVAMGEDIWAPWGGGGLQNRPGFNHLNYYLTAQFQWDADQDIDAVLDEYYHLFYGPAGAAMAAFIDFYEARQHEMRLISGAPLIREALALFEAAKGAVDPESVYGQRLALFEEGLGGIKQHYDRIKDGRVDVPTYTLARDAAEMDDIVIDGRLDEPFWSELPGRLVQLQTGEDVNYATEFKLGVHGDNLYVGILCHDEAGQPLNAMELPRNDFALWQGDVVEILLETPAHSYYQIAVNPVGSLADLDRGAGLAHGTRWDAQAEVAVHVDQAAGFWSVEMRIPFTPSSQDPLHEVVGPPPSADAPWHFNICRQRTREQGADTEVSAFSPTGERGFHNILRFSVLE